MGKLKAVIFDFDGTIADSVDAFIGIARELSGSNTKIEVEELKSLRGLLRFTQRINIPTWQLPFMLRKVRSMVDQHIDEVGVFDGMPEVIKKLHESGYKLYIVSTNVAPTIKKFLISNKLDAYFSSVYGSRNLSKSKVRSLKRLLSNNKLKPSQCVYVGDELRDIEASRSVGIPCVSVSWGFADPSKLQKLTPTALVDSPSQIFEAISRLSN